MSSSEDEEKPRVKSRAEELLEEELVKKWTLEQIESRKKLILKDTEPWQINRSVYEGDPRSVLDHYQNDRLRYVAGMDISFVKGDDRACSGLFVFDLADNFNIVYKDVDSEPITMQLPYVPGFLAYREAGFLLSKLSKLRSTSPHLYPHCLLVDGNGLLQQNGFGMACHIGLASDTPTIGVSKKLFQVRGLENNAEHKARIKSELIKAGDYFELHDRTGNGELIGLCYRAADNASNPIYVSVGNKMSWATCRWLLPLVITKYRIPEPIRMADFHTREFIRALLAPPKPGKK